MGSTMSPADAVWFLGETRRNPMTISTLLWLDGPVDVDVLRRRLEERILAPHPAFRQRIVRSRLPGRLPRWEDVERFDLDDHLDVVVLPEPGTHALLEARCSLERSTPFDRTRPLWQLTVYRGYRGDGTAIHIRLHHSLGDGIALVRLLLALCDEQPSEAEDGTRAGEDHGEPDPSSPGGPAGLGRVAGSLATFAAGHVAHPARLVTTARQLASVPGWTARLFLPDLVPGNVLQGTPQGTKRMAWDPDGHPLAPVKAAGRLQGATVNEVLLTILTGALHRYLAERDALVDVVQVMMPVALRDPGAPLPPHLGNRIGLLPVHLPVGSGDPHEHLRRLRAQTDTFRHSPAPLISHLLLAGTSLTTARGARGLHRFNQWRSTGVITNVPGPNMPLHIDGSRLLGTVGWGGLTTELNLTGSFISLGGRVFAGFVSDTAVTADPDRLLDHLHAVWPEVVAALADAPGGSASAVAVGEN